MQERQSVEIGKIIRNAIVFNFKNWAGKTVQPDDLLQLVGRLFGLLKERNIEYVLVGGVALLNYIEGRNTQDIDLIMALDSLKKLPEIQVTSRDPNFLRGQFGELGIDILLSRNPLFRKVLRKYSQPRHFLEQEIPTATIEGLLLLKLYALPSLYRQGNFARVGLYENDIATLIYTYRPDREPLFSELSHHLNATDLQSLREIVGEIQSRIDRFRKASGEGAEEGGTTG